METKIDRRAIFALVLASWWLIACAQTGKPQTDRELRGMGMVVESSLAKGAGTKAGVSAITDAGNQVFAHALLTSNGGGTSSIGGGTKMSFPRWVRVTWREGVDEKAGLYWTTGTVAGDYKVEVLSRIPPEVFNYVSAARGRAIILKFRIKNDGVLFAWAVQESSTRGNMWVYKLEGGDF